MLLQAGVEPVTESPSTPSLSRELRGAGVTVFVTICEERTPSIQGDRLDRVFDRVGVDRDPAVGQ